MSETTKKRPEFRNINAFADLPSYRWPLAALVSGMHRISGLLIFILLPFIVWMFDTSVTSEISFARFTSIFSEGAGFLPGWFIKLVTLGLIWAYLHHFIAGIRHVYFDISHQTTKTRGRHTAAITIILAFGLTAILGAKLFGLY
ncbi:MAG: succinate dehydrogenase, cytochrome b556 subunit [Comamonas sp. SCN 65-56]|uniref:succinate dehydrogenase, cytochrome b556 subunit n=1 Tax=Comamonas sp. SCN 65-56 TaxID=1660095 RepID=UPI0008689C49|nr:succinate dehydrogenase, cytochrome b556 subunit [Comamonas sp. SCN 65-56]ODS92182.1 MAG: succinate dehydrogenase, cytochrome b556 subunit [Comamonas sp. SCN 65-56]